MYIQAERTEVTQTHHKGTPDVSAAGTNQEGSGMDHTTKSEGTDEFPRGCQLFSPAPTPQFNDNTSLNGLNRKSTMEMG